MIRRPAPAHGTFKIFVMCCASFLLGVCMIYGLTFRDNELNLTDAPTTTTPPLPLPLCQRFADGCEMDCSFVEPTDEEMWWEGPVLHVNASCSSKLVKVRNSHPISSIRIQNVMCSFMSCCDSNKCLIYPRIQL